MSGEVLFREPRKSRRKFRSDCWGVRKLRVRVLASNGIATGVAEVELEQPREQNPPALDIVAIAEITDGIVTLLPNGNLNVTVVDELGRTVGDPNILWSYFGGLQIHSRC